jgi:hypothetical protein
LPELRAQPAKALSSHLPALAPLLIFADQFEELFWTSEAGRQDFAALWDALLDVEGVYLALTLRSEVLCGAGRLARCGETGAEPYAPRSDHRRRTLPATHRPPGNGLWRHHRGHLVSELATTARGMAGALPLLALTLQRLFESRDPVRGITRAAWQAVGGLAESVKCATAPVDEVIDSDPALLAACNTLFAALANSVDGIPTRRSACVAGLRGDGNLAYLIDALRTQACSPTPMMGMCRSPTKPCFSTGRGWPAGVRATPSSWRGGARSSRPPATGSRAATGC